MFFKSTRAKAAAIVAFGGVTVGGLAAAGALPGVSPASPPVSTPSPNSHAEDHPNIGAENGTDASSAKGDNAHIPETAAATDTTADAATDAATDETAASDAAEGGSRSTGLATAQDNVTSPT